MSHCLVHQSDEAIQVYSDPEYLELSALVDKILLKSKSYAPWHYYIKILILLGAIFSLEVYMFRSRDYNWKYMGFEGWLLALVGMNIMHDANHGAISAYPFINRM